MKCEVCQKPTQKYSKGDKYRKTCSRECLNKLIEKNMQGKGKNTNWGRGVSR